MDRVELRLHGRGGPGVAGHPRVVPVGVGLAVTGDRGDDAVLVDPADAGAALLGDVDVAGRVGGDAPGPVEVGGAGRAAVAGGVGRDRVLVGLGRPLGRLDVAGDGRDLAVGADLADEVVLAVGQVHRAIGHGPDALGHVELGVGGEPAVTAVALGVEVARHPVDGQRRGLEVDLEDHVPAAVADVEHVVGRHEHRLGELQDRLLGRAVGPAVLLVTAGDRRDRAAGGVDLPDPVVEAVGQVDVALGVDGHAVGLVQLGLGRRAAVAAEGAGRASAVVGAGRVAGHRRDDAVLVDPPDPVVEGVGDVHVAVPAEGHRPGVVELGVGGLAAVAGEAALAVVRRHAGDRADRAGRVAGIRPGHEAEAGAGGRQGRQRSDREHACP